ncbi:SpaA isopeptide-forming pilin-related protein [Bifidobacterium leontopitheci]|uniref:PA14 domain-containing protein n=1 Tax=Bifidobacterium leontopitheci TaxID=2650774 RepID=A0A6I1GKC2_9BIFI|nr:FctA domain-containing protein [Bifidobacterium leontopitheci]KAB7789827.1 hypothetical protein F7D09_1670 [Bifidobacterium leontopitheci]
MSSLRDVWRSISKRLLAAGSAAAMMATVGVAGTALAANPTPAATDAAAPYALGDHVVKGVSPNGTTINAFDYWLDGRDADDNSDPTNWSDIGINAGQQLKFYSRQGDLPAFNTWTGTTTPRTGMVKSTLQNGYPMLQRSASLGITQDESLAYLFDGSSHSGKASYMDTKGLLQVDDNGYYYYNANRDAMNDGTFQSANYATLDTGESDGNAWTLYDTWGVRTSTAVRDSQNGQFFPFNPAADVLRESGGTLAANDRTSVSPGMNHHFGLSMSSRFVQPNGGRIEKTNQDMKYHFSGDDDVWVFIDGVLVGDLGGIHIASSLDVNFRTGEVSVTGRPGTTLKDLYQAAGATSVTQWNGDTFADGTYHTLNFFYLERGGSDSNMSLKFNLKTIPESDIHKVDQNNEPVRGARFTLYTVNADYSGGRQEVGSGTTDENGLLVLQDGEGKVVSFDDLHTRGFDHYILEETVVPSGYRKAVPMSSGGSSGMHLRYVEDQSSTTGTKSGVVLSVTDPADTGSMWHTGSLALPKVTTTASTTIRDVDGNTVDPSNGLMFAVVLKRDKSKGIGDTDAWHGVHGDQLNGWKYEPDTGMQGVVDTIKANKGADVFSLTSSGGYEVTVDNLPGNIEQYYYMLPDGRKDQAEYTVAYYYAAGARSVDDVTVRDTVRLDFDNADDPFVRQFSVNFYVSNVKNELFVQKVDGTGRSLADGTFSLYRVSGSQSGDGTSDCATTDLGEPYDTVTTVGRPDDAAQLKVNGTAMFPSAGHVLESGTYCLVETQAPSGYVASGVRSKVVVNDYGVFVDAGKPDDGLRVLRGAGWLVRPMSSFATNDDTDNTLTWITSAPGTVTGFTAGSGAPTVDFNDVSANASRVSRGGDDTGGTAAGEVVIGNATTDPLRLKYDVGDDKNDTAPALKYGYSPREPDGDTLFAFDSGFGIISSTQDDANTKDSDYNSEADRTGLRAGAPDNDDKVAGTNKNLTADVRLSNVVTGSVIAQFTNEAAPVLKISKSVEGEGAKPDSDAEFGFTVTLKAGDGELALADGYPYATCTVDDKEAVGYRDCGPEQTMTLGGDGTGAIALKDGQVAVFASLPEGVRYTVAETSMPAGFYRLRVESKDGGATKVGADGTASGVIGHTGERHVHVVNGYGVKATAGVTKRVTGADWTAPDGRGFSFTLRRAATDGSDAPVYVMTDDSAGNGTVTAFPEGGVTASTKGGIRQDATQDVDFGQLVFTKPGTYEFLVAEDTADPASGWSYDVTKRNGSDGQGVKVTVTVTADTDGRLVATVTYGSGSAEGSGEGPGRPTFVNSFAAVSSLPMTGGTMRDWLIVGGVVAGLAAAVAAGACQWRRRKGMPSAL